MAWMNAVGECVWRAIPGPVAPGARGRRPSTVDRRVDGLHRVVGCARSERYAGAEAFVPSGVNCGSQKRFRFGSLPTMIWSKLGNRRDDRGRICGELGARSASAGSRWPACRPRRNLDPVRSAAASTLRSVASSSAVGAAEPGLPVGTSRGRRVNPARRSCASFASAARGRRANGVLRDPERHRRTGCVGRPADAEAIASSTTRRRRASVVRRGSGRIR